MRFLCLHGSGTSAEIMSYQLNTLRQHLNSTHSTHHTFDFWDGPESSPAGPGVSPFFHPPYYIWWTDSSPSTSSSSTTTTTTTLSTTSQQIHSAATTLLARLASSGQTYDAVIGFSQGSALLAATTLLCQRESRPLPWKGAICFSGGLPLTFLERYMPVSEEAKTFVNESYAELLKASSRLDKKITEMMETGSRLELWDTATPLWKCGKDEELTSRDPWSLPPQVTNDLKNVFHLDLSDVPEGIKLQIPIAVVYGHKDPMCAYHVQLALLCEEKRRLVYDHCGGHEIPRSPGVVKDLAKIVQWLDEQIA